MDTDSEPFRRMFSEYFKYFFNMKYGNDKALVDMIEEIESNRDYLWKTADGTVIDIRYMGDDHLRNAMKMLQRKRMPKIWVHMVEESVKRGLKGIVPDAKDFRDGN